MINDFKKISDLNDFVFLYTLLKIKGIGKKKICKYVCDNNRDLDSCKIRLKTFLKEDELSVFVNKINKTRDDEKLCRLKRIGIITMFNSCYPRELLSGKDPCIYLFYQGNINLLGKKGIAVIGTRNPDNDYLERSDSVIKSIVENDYVVISGLALGCDAYAQSKCLDYGGKTIAVLPCPIDDIYPWQNKYLAKRIVDNNSLLISEYEPNAPISKYVFPERDRIQSMLSSRVFVIQASDNSGTMICVNRSLEDGKKVFCLKGNEISKINNYIDENNINELFD